MKSRTWAILGLVIVSTLLLAAQCPFGANPTYTVTYHGNGNTGGSVPTDSNRYEQGDTVTVAENNGGLVRFGYAFADWNTAADGTGQSYAAGSTFAMGDGDVTLWAQWTLIIDLPITHVPGGSFQRDGTATNTTTVSPFYMSTYPITQAQYVAVTGKANPSYFSEGEEAPNRPVERVNWYDALVFCNMLSMAEGRTPVYTISGSTNPADWGEVPTDSNESWDAVTMNMAANGYRLPTEAEWMWAAMGATSGHDYSGSGVYTTGYLKAFAGSTGTNSINDYAWFGYSSSPQGTATEYMTYPVGSKLPNELGLYDMSGNVWDWIWDWRADYPSDPLTNPTGPESGTNRALRGSSWAMYASWCAVAHRGDFAPNVRLIDVGFRVVSR